MTGTIPVTENRNIAAYLPQMAAQYPNQQAVVCPHGRDQQGRTAYSFAELELESNLIAGGLTAMGISQGVRTVLMVTPSLDFFAMTFALFKVGAVPILIDPGMGLKNLKQCLREAEPEAFVGIPKAHLARILLNWPKVKRQVTVGPRFFWGGASLKELRRLGMGVPVQLPKLKDSSEAAILFTSGSTGAPKGAIYTHGIFQAQVAILRRIYQIEQGEVDLATFPLFALFAPALGMTAIIPNMDFTRPSQVDPKHIIDLVQKYQVTNMFGSPALLNRVGRFGQDQGTRLASLKRVISAGAPVHGKIMGTFQKLLSEGVQIFTPYGATESLPVASIGSEDVLEHTAKLTAQGAGVCVGKPVEEIEVAVIHISDEPIEVFSDNLRVEPGEIGEFAVKGPMVTKAYFNREHSTRLAKINDRVAGGVWHRMGDVGYMDELGRLWFCGRKSHRVSFRKGPMFTIPCEGVFNAHPDVFRTALVGVRDQQNTNHPVLCVELEAEIGKRDEATLRRELLALGAQHPHTQIIQTILFHPAFPVDIRHNAKIFREQLADWATTQVKL